MHSKLNLVTLTMAPPPPPPPPQLKKQCAIKIANGLATPKEVFLTLAPPPPRKKISRFVMTLIISHYDNKLDALRVQTWILSPISTAGGAAHELSLCSGSVIEWQHELTRVYSESPRGLMSHGDSNRIYYTTINVEPTVRHRSLKGYIR